METTARSLAERGPTRSASGVSGAGAYGFVLDAELGEDLALVVGGGGILGEDRAHGGERLDRLGAGEPGQ